MKGAWILLLVTLAALVFCAACDLSGESDGWGDKQGQAGGDDDDDDNCTDKDDDGWCDNEDCNDYNKSVNPGALEDCYDLIDNDCDFLTDEQDPDCPGIGD